MPTGGSQAGNRLSQGMCCRFPAMFFGFDQPKKYSAAELEKFH
jgi:hypothetical protein